MTDNQLNELKSVAEYAMVNRKWIKVRLFEFEDNPLKLEDWQGFITELADNYFILATNDGKWEINYRDVVKIEMLLIAK